MEKRYKKYVAVMVLCFLFGGFSIGSYLLQVYSAVWQEDIGQIIRGETRNFPPLSVFNESNFTNTTEFNRNRFLINPYSALVSPISLILLFTGIASLLAGFSIWNLVREKEIKSTKKAMLDIFLLPEEKKVLEEIEKEGGSIRQNEIVRNTGFSRVKVHRVIKNLEKKNLVMKQQYGMTNKIALKR
jgi:hypothetical protein